MMEKMSTCVFLLVIQTYTAIYYVFADLLMLGMYLYYKMWNRMLESECFLLLNITHARYKIHVLLLSCWCLRPVYLFIG